jgi:hypothetical protein
MASVMNEYRENAEECMGWARTARSDRERQIFLQMAQAWRAVAAHREHADLVARPKLEQHAPADFSRAP